MVIVICSSFLFKNIIKEWRCFARQKTFHRGDAKNAEERKKEISRSQRRGRREKDKNLATDIHGLTQTKKGKEKTGAGFTAPLTKGAEDRPPVAPLGAASRSDSVGKTLRT